MQPHGPCRLSAVRLTSTDHPGVDRVVQMHQGTLALRQTDNGQGLKVVVTFQRNLAGVQDKAAYPAVCYSKVHEQQLFSATA